MFLIRTAIVMQFTLYIFFKFKRLIVVIVILLLITKKMNKIKEQEKYISSSPSPSS